MFGFFSKKNNNECPIDTEMRLWMENAFLWLAQQFGEDHIATKPMLYPTPEHFPIRYDGSVVSLTKTAEIVARQMDIDMNEIDLDIYEQDIQEFRGDLGHRIWTEVDKDSEEKLSAGLYFEKNEEGKYGILIEKKNLSDPENMVATLAHEFAHIKLLGESRLDFNDENLTDLTPVLFGLGINGDNGEILYNRTELQKEFEKAVDEEDLEKTKAILIQHPEFAKDETYFWGEGILTFAAKENNHQMIDLLLSYGAKVPAILKWTQFYYFLHPEGAAYMMKKGMDPNTMSWHHVTILHDMAQKGNLAKAELLIKYGADINPVDEEYQSTPLGMASRWGHIEMVKYLLEQGADPNKAGAAWATPLAWAKKKGFAEIEDVLRKAGSK